MPACNFSNFFERARPGASALGWQAAHLSKDIRESAAAVYGECQSLAICRRHAAERTDKKLIRMLLGAEHFSRVSSSPLQYLL